MHVDRHPLRRLPSPGCRRPQQLAFRAAPDRRPKPVPAAGARQALERAWNFRRPSIRSADLVVPWPIPSQEPPAFSGVCHTPSNRMEFGFPRGNACSSLPPCLVSAGRSTVSDVGRLRGGSGPAASAPSDRAERRQLTLMFCDVVDSVGLSVRLDPEDLRDLIHAYQRACVAAVERYDGYVAAMSATASCLFRLSGGARRQCRTRITRRPRRDRRRRRRRTRHQGADRIATGLVVVGDGNAQGVADQGAVGRRGATSPPDCRASPSPTLSWSPMPRAGSPSRASTTTRW